MIFNKICTGEAAQSDGCESLHIWVCVSVLESCVGMFECGVRLFRPAG